MQNAEYRSQNEISHFCYASAEFWLLPEWPWGVAGRFHIDRDSRRELRVYPARMDEIPVQQGFCGNDESRSTVSALHAMVFDVFLKQGCLAVAMPSTVSIFLPVAFDSQRHASEDRPAVHNNGARSAGSVITHQFGAVKPSMS